MIEIAQILLEISAVGFRFDQPITFKSGILSPVYVDNRRLPFFPEQWTRVIEAFAATIKKQKLDCDVIAGIETAGIPHSAALGFVTKTSSVFVRKQPKDHGTKKRIEGGDVSAKKVVLVEDLITTGGSSLSGVEAIRNEGGVVTACLAIVSYGFPEAKDAFAAAGVKLLTLTTFAEILTAAKKQMKISASEASIIEQWLANPREWQPKE